jgi:BirA family biotin operon repressor/biotin-[acetyl-CoA-carboxylase] ligase
VFAKVKPNTQFIGQNIIYFNQVDSTNTFAIELMKQNMAEDGTVVVAEFQGKGRGQSKNVWISEAFENLLFSIVLKPVTNFNADPFSLNKTIAVSIHSVLKSLLPHHTVHIKWPNDVLIERRKVAGILIENNFIGNRLNWSVAGIGLNVNQKLEHISDLQATSLGEKTGNTLDRAHVLKLILEEFEQNYLLLQAGNKNKLNKQFDEALLSYQESTEFKTQNGTFEAVIMGCDGDGRLLLKHSDGNTQAHIHGSIKQIIHA